MTAKMEQSQAINPNPVISVAKDGTVLYSNEAGKPLLHEWGVRVREKLPPYIKIFVHRVISQEVSEKIKIKVGERVYFIIFHPLPEQECVNIYGFDISESKRHEGKLQESESLEMPHLELANIIDVQAIQSMMEDFYKLANIPIALVDLKGNVLACAGWQDICTRFHRVHPESCKHCMESYIKLSSGVLPREFKLNKCKNNMWDIATSIIVGDRHVGYAFSGQFFFEDEPVDYELFRVQARKYGFNEQEYIAALDKVPRLSPIAVDICMSFLTTFANMVSQLGYSNIKLYQSLAERDAVLDALQESEKRLYLLSNNLPESAVYQYVLEPDGSTNFLYFSTGIECLFGISMSDLLRDPNTLYRHVPRTYLEQLVEAEARSALELSDIDMELSAQLPNGQAHWIRLHSRPRRLPDGRTIWDGVLTDITKLKQAEEVLCESESRRKVTEAVDTERKRFFDVLEALPIMVALLTPDHRIAFANRCFREKFGELGDKHCFEYCFGRNEPCEFCKAYNVLETGKPHHWEITMPNGSMFDAYDLPFTDVDGSPMILEMDIDITKRKEAEEALANIETARKKEIHHRIKNNLQVISSLLDLQAEQFRDREDIKDSEVLEAFRESQDRVISMALIHEELYRGGGFETLNFSPYIQELAENLLLTYMLGNSNITLSMNLEENVSFDMDTAVPLGIIVNELVSNSLKHAFPDREKGETQIKISREEKEFIKNINEDWKRTNFILTVSDDGIGIPENLEIEELDSLGFQLITSLVDQLDGKFELKRNNGTEFIMRFTVTEKDNLA